MAAASDLPERVLLLAGPTASGKTELAAELALALDAEVVGADSRQVYRYMDVGTAKPPAELRARVRHHMIDVVDPGQDYDVARWRQDAMAALAEIAARGKRAIVCGGTGLYLRSLTRGLFTGPAADQALRARLAAAEEAEPGSLYRRLRCEDAETAERLHPNDRLRIVRALEVLELSGRPLSVWHREHRLADTPFAVLTLELRVAPEELAARILERSRKMVADGIVEELAGLLERGYPRQARAFAAIGYPEAARCLGGALSRAELPEAIAAATRRYAKRQRTWLRGQTLAVALHRDRREQALSLAEAFFS